MLEKLKKMPYSMRFALLFSICINLLLYLFSKGLVTKTGVDEIISWIILVPPIIIFNLTKNSVVFYLVYFFTFFIIGIPISFLPKLFKQKSFLIGVAIGIAFSLFTIIVHFLPGHFFGIIDNFFNGGSSNFDGKDSLENIFRAVIVGALLGGIVGITINFSIKVIKKIKESHIKT
jgi:hypothetical protein